MENRSLARERPLKWFRVRSLATAIQARWIVTDDVHASYWKDALSVLDFAGSDKARRTEHRGD